MRLLTLLSLVASTALAQTVIPPSIWNFTYPWPLHYHTLTSQRLTLSMAYMDVPPSTNSTSCA